MPHNHTSKIVVTGRCPGGGEIPHCSGPFQRRIALTLQCLGKEALGGAGTTSSFYDDADHIAAIDQPIRSVPAILMNSPTSPPVLS